MSSFEEALHTFYNGEVAGEAAYSAMLAHAHDPGLRLKLGTLLQLETETKAWLRAPMVSHGVGIEERAEDRQQAQAIADQFSSMPWEAQMQGLCDFLSEQVVPTYQAFADAAKARGAADEEAVCVYMVEHEKAQVEFARRELAGASIDEALEPIVRFLRYPLRP
jgi:hypothetical protein